MNLTEFKEKIAGKAVCVLGIGISNTPLIDFLLKCGASVYARDRKTPEKLGALYAELEKKGVELKCGENYLDGITEKIIFKAPGIRCDIDELKKAKENGAVITSEMELFCALCPCDIIAVTGSDGKTTSTTLISLILKKQKELYGEKGKVWVGGNIGTPLLPYVAEMKKEDTAVLELSSFQLHCMCFSPSVAVITNISPNHLNWHTDMNEYIDSKRKIFAHMKSNGRVVLNYNCRTSRDIVPKADLQTIYFNSPNEHGVYLKNGVICCEGEKILDCDKIKIPGRHNIDNYMTATAALYGKVSAEAIRCVAEEFGGVEHRIEFVHSVNGVKYYNSSIDSSPSRTVAALNSFKQKLIVILGGYDKKIPYDVLVEPLYEHCRAIVLTGATGKKLYELVTSCELYRDGGLEVLCEDDFTQAVLTAAKLAVPGDIVLLSPAAASFDKFENFEERGRAFKKIVNDLAEEKQ